LDVRGGKNAHSTPKKSTLYERGNNTQLFREREDGSVVFGGKGGPRKQNKRRSQGEQAVKDQLS